MTAAGEDLRAENEAIPVNELTNHPSTTGQVGRRCAAGIYTAGRWGAWAVCGCGWSGPTVHGGAVGASVSWARHVAQLARQRRRFAELTAAGTVFLRSPAQEFDLR